ncbi:MAG: TadE/TadG family type IV pilus assembly protein [Bacteroidota bacterium]
MNVIKNEDGSVIVEFALVSMLLILLLAGIIQFGLVFNTFLVLEDAARNAARTAAIATLSDDQIKSNIINSISPLVLDYSNIQIEPAIRTRGQMFTVTINYQYQIPVTFGILPESYSLTAKTSMLSEI